MFNRDVERRPVISEAIAYQMVSMLADVMDVGTGAAARSLGVRFPAAGKTGTTDDFKDAWFVGFSSSVVAGVWVGFDRPATIGADGYGARYALPMWADFMAKAARVRVPEDFRIPTTVDGVRLCRVSHLLPRDSCPAYTEYFKHGDIIPDGKCDVHRGPNAAEVIGGIFSKIGKGIGKIFGR